MKNRLVVGCMTGTSLDGLDAALVRIRGEGLAMKVEVVRTISRSFMDRHDHEVDGLRALADGRLKSNQIANIARWFSIFHANIIAELLQEAGGVRPDLICVHGQTVYHAPPASWQLFNPWPLAHRIGAPVVFDLRGADLAAGGQGAPITPLADWILFRNTAHAQVMVNLGGYCNMTFLPKSAPGTEEAEIRAIRARDVCACNHLLDQIAREALGRSYDKDGEAALRGVAHGDAAAELQQLLEAQSRSGRSLGTGDEVRNWVRAWRPRMTAENLAASAAGAIAGAICATINEHPGALALLAGGGVKNQALRTLIEFRSPTTRPTTDQLAMIEYRESVAMAVLGALCQDRVAITLPHVTGVPSPAPVAGCWVHPS